MPNDRDDIAKILKRLTTQRSLSVDGLSLGPANAPGAFDEVLTVIEDTILMRDVVVAVASEFLTLRVSGRRIKLIVAATPTVGIPAELILTPLDEHQKVAVGVLRDSLDALLTFEGTLSVRREPVPENEAPNAAGISVASLVEGEQRGSTPREAFMEMVSGVASATLSISGGQVLKFTGQSEAINEMRALIGSTWVDFDASHRAFLNEGEENFRLFVPWARMDVAVCVLSSGKEQFFATIDRTRLADIVAAWSHVHR